MMLRIEFDEQVWSKIIDVLADRPFKECGAIINTMAQQFAEQRQQPESARPQGNGKLEVESVQPSPQR